MLKPVRPDRHTRSNELSHLCTTQRTGLIEPTRDDEERALQPVTQKRGQRMRDVRCVSVVERETDPAVLADDREKLVELSRLDPIKVFVRL